MYINKLLINIMLIPVYIEENNRSKSFRGIIWDSLLSFEIMIDIDFLKYNGQ